MRNFTVESEQEVAVPHPVPMSPPQPVYHKIIATAVVTAASFGLFGYTGSLIAVAVFAITGGLVILGLAESCLEVLVRLVIKWRDLLRAIRGDT